MILGDFLFLGTFYFGGLFILGDFLFWGDFYFGGLLFWGTFLFLGTFYFLGLFILGDFFLLGDLGRLVYDQHGICLNHYLLYEKYFLVLLAGIDMTLYFNNCLVKYLHATFLLFWVWKLLLCLHHYNSIFSDHSHLGDHSQVFWET